MDNNQIDNNLGMNYQTQNNWSGSGTYISRITSTSVSSWWLWMCSSVFHESNASKTTRIRLETGSKWLPSWVRVSTESRLSRIESTPLRSLSQLGSELRLGSARVGSDPGSASGLDWLELDRVKSETNGGWAMDLNRVRVCETQIKPKLILLSSSCWTDARAWRIVEDEVDWQLVMMVAAGGNAVATLKGLWLDLSISVMAAW